MKAVAAGCLLIMVTSPAWAQQTNEDRPRITVNGEAVVDVKPDKILVSFGIETWDGDILAAKQKNNEILKKAVAAARECGVREKDIQTDHLSIQPRWKNPGSREGFLGYYVRNSFVVTLTDADKVEDLVTTTLQAGVNYIHNVDFQTTEFKKYREQARELALNAAAEKARKMANVLGQSIGSPISINETYSGSPSWYYSNWGEWGYSRGMGMSQSNVQVERGGSGDITDTIALGKVSIRASVVVVFEMKR